MKRNNKYVVTFELEYLFDSNVSSEGVGNGFQKYFDVLDSGEDLNICTNPNKPTKTTVVKVTNSTTGDSYVAPKAGEVAS